MHARGAIPNEMGPTQEEEEEGDPHGQGGKPPCKQAKRVRPEGGCGVFPMEIFFDFLLFFSQKNDQI